MAPMAREWERARRTGPVSPVRLAVWYVTNPMAPARCINAVV